MSNPDFPNSPTLHIEDCHCDQCDLVSIQGVACHERGCPNDWIDPTTGEGYPVECGWCGERFAPYKKGETCCSDDCQSHFSYY